MLQALPVIAILHVMTVFAIMTPAENPQLPSLQDALIRVFGERYRSVGAGQYLGIKTGVTAHQISEMLGNRGQVGQFMVLAASGYHGWHDKDIWEWIAAQEAVV